MIFLIGWLLFILGLIIVAGAAFKGGGTFFQEKPPFPKFEIRLFKYCVILLFGIGVCYAATTILVKDKEKSKAMKALETEVLR